MLVKVLRLRTWYWPGPDLLGERRITTVCCDEAVPPRGQVWMVLGPDPLRERGITTVCCDEAVPPRGQVWMVLAWPRPPRREENHDGMLR